MLSQKTASVLKISTAIGILALAFYAGTFVKPVEFEQQATTVIAPTVECELVERHTVQYVERLITVGKSTERVQNIPVNLRNFNDLEEMKQWLVTMSNNTTTVYFQPHNTTVDCDDYALDLQRKALADGYIVSFQVIGTDEYKSLFKCELPSDQSRHAINLAIIGNNAYYIEPQTNETVFAAYLD